MTSSFAPRIKSSSATLLLAACVILGGPACDKKAEPEKPSSTALATTQTIPSTPSGQVGGPHGSTTGTSTNPTAIPNSPHGNSLRNPHNKIPMAGRPDLSKMPNDAVHAPYRRAPRMGGGPMTGKGMQQPAETDDHPTLPLVKTGPRSVKELNDRLAKESDPAVKERLEKGFRLTFSTKKNRQTAMEAAKVLAGLETGTSGATAYRVLAYVSILTGGGFKRSQEQYAKAVELDPKYGAAHYGLAFSLLWSPTPEVKARGRMHFETAMKLGVEDTSNLRGRFYPNAK